MPQIKYEGEIFLFTNHRPDDLKEEATTAGVTSVYSKTGPEGFKLFKSQTGKVVAVVDDEEKTARDEQDILVDQGKASEVVIFTDPLDALQKIPIHTPQFNVVFLDYNMLGINGIELARRLRTGE